MKRVCVVAVHPDDETLGCGGAILKHLMWGDEVSCILVTGGNSNQMETWKKVKNEYGFANVFEFNLSELSLMDMSLNQLIPLFSNTFNKIKPQILYIPNRSDAHSDHKAVYQAISATSKSFRYPYIERLLMCEVMSETDFALPLNENVFIPNYFIDISEVYPRKEKILEYYQSELLPYPLTRSVNSIRALNRYRGSQINAEFAESFMLIKEIKR